jgi:hypothetical protein
VLIKRDRSDKENNPSVKKINFREIVDCYLPLEKHEAIMRGGCHEDFTHPFILKTNERVFELYSSLKQERELWLTAFKYVVKSLKVVQSLIHVNDSSIKIQSK